MDTKEGGPRGCHKYIPQEDSTKGLPNRGLPRGVTKDGSFDVVFERGAHKRGPQRCSPKRSYPRSVPKWCDPKGGSPRVETKGVPERWSNTSNPSNGVKRVVHVGGSVGGHLRWVPKGGQIKAFN